MHNTDTRTVSSRGSESIKLYDSTSSECNGANEPDEHLSFEFTGPPGYFDIVV